MFEKTRLPYADPANWARAKNTPGARRDFTTHDYIPGQAIPTHPQWCSRLCHAKHASNDRSGWSVNSSSLAGQCTR